MSTIVNPLQALIGQAAKQTGTGEATRFRQRTANATNIVAILADVSTSMLEGVGLTTKYSLLRTALSQVLPDTPNARLIAFSAVPVLLNDVAELPQPGGDTALDLAIDAAAALRPRQTVVISDGRPNEPDKALASASRLTGRIDVIYCGPESDQEAIAFLRRLAFANGGAYHQTAPSNLIEPMKLLLTE